MPHYNITESNNTITVYINFDEARKAFPLGSQLYEYAYKQANQYLKPSKFIHTKVNLDKDWIVFSGQPQEG